VGHSESLAVQLLYQYSYLGLGIGMFLNCLGIPIAAEIVLPLTGALAKAGGMNLWGVMIVAMIAQIAGLFMAYAIARHGGLKLLERFGHLVFLKPARLEQLHRTFKRHGFRLVFTGLYLPGAHGYMGYIAGLGKMHFPVFAWLVVTSTVVWTAVFVGLGYFLTDHLDSIITGVTRLGWIGGVVLLLVLAAIWYHMHHRRNA
jgi:membrane protein DedA with SNARE-associated domain